MGILNKLREQHPGVQITAYDGHYARIGDEQSEIINHLKLEAQGRSTIATVVNQRRKALKAPEIMKQLDQKIEAFKTVNK